MADHANAGFFARHLNGDYGLGRSYWAHTFLLASLVPNILLVAFIAMIEPMRARQASTAVLIIFVISTILWVWGIVGTWRSANKHAARGGKEFWAKTAKVMIVLGVFSTMIQSTLLGPSIVEHWQVMLGAQAGPKTKMHLQIDNRTVVLSGGINDGTAAQLESILAIAPELKTVMLHSPGGWIHEGIDLARVISSHGLNTYAEGECSSACTIAFLAGKERSIAPQAQLGFHSARTVGAIEGIKYTDPLIEIYRAANLPEEMIHQIAQTPHSKIWYPTHEELLAAGLLTQHSMANETAVFVSEFSSREMIENSLEEVGWIQALKQNYSDKYRKLIDISWEAAQKGTSDIEIMTFVREQVRGISEKLIPFASDDLLIELFRISIKQLLILREKNVQACVEFAFPSGRPIDYQVWFSEQLVHDENVLIERLIREANPRLAVQPDIQRLNRLRQRIHKNMTNEQIALVNSMEKRAMTDPKQVCEAAKAMSQSIHALPPSDMAWLFRMR